MKTLEKIARAYYITRICMYYSPCLLTKLHGRSLKTLRSLSHRVSREKYLREIELRLGSETVISTEYQYKGYCPKTGE